VENIQSRVQRTIDNNTLLRPGDKVLIALSGGPDSMALLSLLITLKPKYNIALAAAHLDHGLRAESVNDRRFCAKICHKLKIKLFSRRIDLAKFARSKKMSIEEAGRRARYDYFESLAQKHGFTKIATGHTLNDNVETVLFNLARGTGLAGIAGIPYRRDKIIRPLLHIEKSELLAWLKAEKIRFVKDKSNYSLKFARNRIRLNIIPELAKINLAVVQNIARMSDNARQEIEYLESLTVSAYNEALVESGKSKIVLDLGKLVRYDKSLRKRMLGKAVESLGRKAIGSDNLFRALDVIDGKSGGVAPLGQGIFIEKSQGRIAILDTPETPDSIPLPYFGEIKLGPGSILRLGIFTREKLAKLDRGPNAAYLDRAKLGEMRVRYWHQGDTIRPLGMRGLRLLSDIFIDKKIPEYERGLIPLIASGNEIAWIAGVMISDNFKITDDTKEVLSLELCKL
jgi:tRNA(Ile)-lysidine synthase